MVVILLAMPLVVLLGSASMCGGKWLYYPSGFHLLKVLCIMCVQGVYENSLTPP